MRPWRNMSDLPIPDRLIISESASLSADMSQIFSRPPFYSSFERAEEVSENLIQVSGWSGSAIFERAITLSSLLPLDGYMIIQNQGALMFGKIREYENRGGLIIVMESRGGLIFHTRKYEKCKTA